LRLNEKFNNEQDLNKTIIKLQREQQTFLEEQTEFRRKIEALEKDNAVSHDRIGKSEDEVSAWKGKFRI
jgi:hypothetical protein